MLFPLPGNQWTNYPTRKAKGSSRHWTTMETAPLKALPAASQKLFEATAGGHAPYWTSAPLAAAPAPTGRAPAGREPVASRAEVAKPVRPDAALAPSVSAPLLLPSQVLQDFDRRARRGKSPTPAARPPLQRHAPPPGSTPWTQRGFNLFEVRDDLEAPRRGKPAPAHPRDARSHAAGVKTPLDAVNGDEQQYEFWSDDSLKRISRRGAHPWVGCGAKGGHPHWQQERLFSSAGIISSWPVVRPVHS